MSISFPGAALARFHFVSVATEAEPLVSDLVSVPFPARFPFPALDGENGNDRATRTHVSRVRSRIRGPCGGESSLRVCNLIKMVLRLRKRSSLRSQVRTTPPDTFLFQC